MVARERRAPRVQYPNEATAQDMRSGEPILHDVGQSAVDDNLGVDVGIVRR